MDAKLVLILATLGVVRGKLIESCNITKIFVMGHNQRRLQLAKGLVPDQPPATDMTYLTWDEELAKKAADWASRNEYGHNPIRTLPSGKYKSVGENVYIYKTNYKNDNFDPDKAMQSWWDEHYDFTYAPMSKDLFQKKRPKVGHYTAMAWADTVRVGCAISQFSTGKYQCYLVVCNYGPGGNVLEEYPYIAGRPTDYLKCGDTSENNDCNLRFGPKCSSGNRN